MKNTWTNFLANPIQQALQDFLNSALWGNLPTLVMSSHRAFLLQSHSANLEWVRGFPEDQTHICLVGAKRGVESMSKLLLMWAGGGLSLVLGEAGTSRHLGSTENIRMLGENHSPGPGDFFQSSCRNPGFWSSCGCCVGCPQPHCLGLQLGARDLGLPELADKHVDAY